MININDDTDSLFDQNRAKRHCVVNSIVEEKTKKSKLIIREIENSLFTAGNAVESSSSLIHKSKKLYS